MLLSVIIVNYNVKYFLEQCLCSVQKAMVYNVAAGLGQLGDQIEVWVVDNNSPDDSVAFLQPRFPFVKFLANRENIGFARANNQALSQCSGKYILFLNPDTILPEHCFRECVDFMEKQDDAGALGVQMIDGSGRFLPESKRGFPSPWVSFCKMSGLTAMFPTSRLFGKYYLGSLAKEAVHRVDVLSGAFMWVRKEVLDKIGGFDERFFMYAEDIDLSYRIQLAGYENYYLPSPVIIHFKGESTNRNVRYIKLFYTAMIQFVEKYYKGLSARWYRTLLKLVIFLKSTGGNKRNQADQPKDIDLGRLSLLGDKDSILQMTDIIADRHAIAANTGPIVYCEGAELKFADIIEGIAFSQPNTITLIHGYNSAGAVGSDSKNRQGAVIARYQDRHNSSHQELD